MDVSAEADTDGLVVTLEEIAQHISQLDGFYRDLTEWWRYRQTLYFASSKIPRNHPQTIIFKGSAQPLVDTGNLRAATMRNQPFNLVGEDATFGLRKGTPEYKLGILMLSRPRGAPRRDAVPKLNVNERREVVDLALEWIMKGRG